jgi:protein involved in polysaccharide export with SLBB domain
MTMRFVLSLAVLWYAASPLARSQTITNSSGIGTGAQQQMPNSSTVCTDAMIAAGQPCQQGQGYPQSRIPEDTSLPVPLSLGPAQPEDTSLEQQNKTKNDTQLQTFPPDLPTEFQKFVAETTGQLLPLYGEDLFRHVPSTFAPSDRTPVPPNYVIGPDDELRVRIWGQVNFSGNVIVDRSGNLYLPQVGTIPVAGLQFSALDQRLRSAVSKLYRNFDLSVDIGRIRSMQIYVSGRARRPGAYTISSLSSLVDALFATGGPSPQGSLRHIELKRDGQVITDFDLYALLIDGDKSKDVRLLPEDVLYIPPAGPEVAITGSIRNPGIYELRSGESVKDLIEMAGRTSALASNSRIALERVEQGHLRQAMEFDFDAAGLARPLEDGDILRIDALTPAYRMTVTVRGNVANPGRFGWHPGMRLSDLIPNSDSLISRDYWWKRSHLGLPGPEFEPAVSTLGLNQQPVEASPRGLTTSVTQSTLTNALTQDQRSAETSGPDGANPKQSGTNSTLAAGMAQPSNRAGNTPPTPGQPLIQPNEVQLSPDLINWNYAVIERVDPKSLKPSLLPFDLGKLVLNHDASQNLELEPGDTVTIFSQSDIRVPLDEQVKYVEFEGEVVHPGYYSVLPGETLRDLLRRAGGLTPRAYLYGSEFTRESTRVLQQQRLNDYVRDLTLEGERGTQALAMSGSGGSASADVAASRTVTETMVSRLSQIRATGRIVLQFQPKSSSLNDVPAMKLENGDKFVVPFAPENINVVGAVYDQNSYVYEKGRKLGYYLQLAGGSNHNADWRHSFLIRADGSVVSRDHLHGSGFWRNSFEDLKLNPGDSLVVPDKTLHPTALRGFLAWSQIFSQLALGAAAVRVL